MKHKKLLLIGWDAADWKLIKPLVADGKMPAIQRLINKGVSGNIATLDPILSPMLWTSIATGKRAYDHGIHGFVEIDKTKGEVKPVKATSRKAKTFWNILNEAGLKTNVVNWWPSNPIEKLNGAMVSDGFHNEAPLYGYDWPMAEDTVFPSDLYQEIKDMRLHPAELTLAHILPFVENAASLNPEKDKVLKPLMRVLAKCCSVHNATTYLMENTEWDVTAVYYEAIDHFSHLAMKYHPPKQEAISAEDFEKYSGIVAAAYRFHDMMLERLLQLAGDDCHVMLVSDHGFESGELRMTTLPNVPAAPALEHRDYGVFIASGNDFKSHENMYGATLLDVCPTILHFFDLPIGEDMEGKVMHEIWKNPSIQSSIDSWELTPYKPSFYKGDDEVTNKALLQQLEDLGYIDFPANDKVKYAGIELKYNLCRSYLDGNKFAAAATLAQLLYGEHQEERFFLLLVHVQMLLGKYEAVQKCIEAEKPRLGHLPQFNFVEAQLALMLGDINQAQKKYKEVLSKGLNNPQLYNEIAHTFLLQHALPQALQYFNKTLVLDKENAVALSGVGHVYVLQNKFEEALPFFDKSLEQKYFQPNVHYLVAIATFMLTHYDQCLQALQICLQQAPKHKKAKALMAKITGEILPKQITIVSGLPRSGTSMLMQMLYKAGLDVLTDKNRKEDEHNPKGYFEYEAVKKLGVDAGWIKEAEGKVLKVVSPLLRYLPATEQYKVIVIKRPLTEVVLSQEIMKGKTEADVMKNFPFQLAADMQAELEKTEKWIDIQPNIEVLYVDYTECMARPKENLMQIAAFLEQDLDIESGAEAVQKKLRRNKLVE